MQHDNSTMQVMGELKDLFIRLSFDLSIHQMIDIYVVNIPDCYVIFLSSDWSTQLGGYFATDWSHMFVPKKGQNQYQRIERERYMEHMITDPEGHNELVMFHSSILGNYFVGVVSEETITRTK